VCGFVGVAALDGRPLEVARLVEATALLRHRGPDDEGYLLAGLAEDTASARSGPDSMRGVELPPIGRSEPAAATLALGFRRLAILDRSPAGHQPMASADGRAWIAFNGELYNHGDVRAELERDGERFRGRSDTETLLAAYRRWGPGCVERFEGMWAFALWDRERRALLLSRDRFGIKPLYFAHAGERFAFSSEIKALLAALRLPRRVNAGALFDYLRLGITDGGGETLFAGIEELPPAHTLELPLVAGGTARCAPHWQAPRGPSRPCSPAEAAGQVREQLLESVRLHLLSDVPVGVTLSGGIDSSAILAAMRLAEGEAREIHAFSHVADDAACSEERWAVLAAKSTGAILHRSHPTADELLSDLDRLVEVQELPFASTSIYAQHRVFRLAREAGVPVTLGGQGADELFGGYRAHLGGRLASLLRAGRWAGALRFARAAAGLPGSGARDVWLRAGALLLPAPLEPLARRLAGEELAPPWLDAAWFRSRGLRLASRPAPRSSERLRDRLRQALLETSLPMLLRYEDRNAMAHSVESRVPFLHRPLVEAVMRLPEHELIDDDATAKAVLRRALRGVVPDPILDRRDKIGFATPEQSWLEKLGPAVEHLLASGAAEAVQGLRPQVLREEWERIRAGRAPFDFRIWRGINLVAWARVFAVDFV
jgi:asparagine synthase (glutamine-hydrolysing)